MTFMSDKLPYFEQRSDALSECVVDLPLFSPAELRHFRSNRETEKLLVLSVIKNIQDSGLIYPWMFLLLLQSSFTAFCISNDR